MRFRRLVTIMLTLSVVASLMALPVAAIDYSDVVAPLYIGLEDVTADLAISSNGYADCSGAAYVRSGYSVTVVMELQQKNGTWQTIKTWSKSGRSVAARAGACPPFLASATGYSCIREERFLSPDGSLSRLIHSQISHAPESADMLHLEKFIGNRITNPNEAQPGKWRAMIHTERKLWVSDTASLQMQVAPHLATTFIRIMILPR